MPVFKNWPEDLEIKREWSFEETMNASLENPTEITLPEDPDEARECWRRWLQWQEFIAFRHQGKRWGGKTHEACVQALESYAKWEAEHLMASVSKSRVIRAP